MFAPIPFLQSYFVMASIPFVTHLGGVWAFFPIAVLYVIHPSLDLLGGKDAPGRPSAARAGRVWDLLVWASLPALAALEVWAIPYFVAHGHPWLLVFSVGTMAGSVGIVIAHELIHRPRRFERAIGVGLLSLVTYAHFRVNHVFWHHKHVASDRDPSSARRGEGLYAFWVRSIVGVFTTAIQSENARLARAGTPALSTKNRMLHYFAFEAALYLGVFAWQGIWGVVFFASQSAVAILLLETINYMEHYGLQRASDERVTARHSWDCRWRFTNWYLFNLGRHAHHHREASVPYERLENLSEAPEMPAGYSAMFIAAFVPPLWRRIMDPRLDSSAPA